MTFKMKASLNGQMEVRVISDSLMQCNRIIQRATLKIVSKLRQVPGADGMMIAAREIECVSSVELRVSAFDIIPINKSIFCINPNLSK